MLRIMLSGPVLQFIACDMNVHIYYRSPQFALHLKWEYQLQSKSRANSISSKIWDEAKIKTTAKPTRVCIHTYTHAHKTLWKTIYFTTASATAQLFCLDWKLLADLAFVKPPLTKA